MVLSFFTGRNHDGKRLALSGIAVLIAIGIVVNLGWSIIDTLTIANTGLLSLFILFGSCLAFGLTYRYSEVIFEGIRLLQIAFRSATIGSPTDILSAELHTFKESLSSGVTAPTQHITGVEYNSENDSIYVEFFINHHYGVFKFNPSTVSVDTSTEDWIDEFSIRTEDFDAYPNYDCKLCNRHARCISIAVYNSPRDSSAAHCRTCHNCISSAITGIEELGDEEMNAEILAQRI